MLKPFTFRKKKCVDPEKKAWPMHFSVLTEQDTTKPYILILYNFFLLNRILYTPGVGISHTQVIFIVQERSCHLIQ